METGEELLLLHPEIRGAWEVFKVEHNNNRKATCIYRLAGWFGKWEKYFCWMTFCIDTLVTFLGLSCLSGVLEIVTHVSKHKVATMVMTRLHFSVSISLSNEVDTFIEFER